MIFARLMALSDFKRFLVGIHTCNAALPNGLTFLTIDLPEPDRKRIPFESLRHIAVSRMNETTYENRPRPA